MPSPFAELKRELREISELPIVRKATVAPVIMSEYLRFGIIINNAVTNIKRSRYIICRKNKIGKNRKYNFTQY